MPRYYQIISSDGHVEVPPEYWVKHVPAKWRDRAPRLIRLPEGGDAWLIEGQPMLQNGQNIKAGGPLKMAGASYYRPDGTPVEGSGDGVQRLQEQDIDGLDCEVLFPPIFATKFLEGVKDKPVYLSMIQAWNTFLAQDYCSVAPDRLIGVGVIPITGIDDAVAELKRCKQIGLKAVTFYQFPNGGGFSQPEDDRFWSTAQEIGISLAPHVHFGERHPDYGGGARGTSKATVAAAMAQRCGSIAPTYAVCQLIYNGIFDRFPNIEFYFAETNGGWMPGLFYFLDDNYALFKDWYKVSLKMKPTEYLRKHVYFGIIHDPIALKLRDHLPADRFMWGSDHPHSVCTFGRSRQALAEIFNGVPDALRRKILLENPAKFFGLDLKKPITETPKRMAKAAA